MDGDPDRHPDLAEEQAAVEHAYRCLAVMRERTAAAVAIGESAAQAVDSAIATAHLTHRLRSLDPDVDGLAFGRLDHETGKRWYVGRRHVEDDAGDPVVVDWRAGVSTPFYRATAADPLELSRRRRFMMTGRRLDDLFDEVFDDPDSVHAARHGGIPDPLLAELERSRTGEMRDIAATIAAEQDVVIRAGLGTCLVVQGGPGTGKTAVGLHRAAFLLYEHREQLDREGVLVIGPNPVFLRYIAQVLPSLGEAATRQTTMAALVGGRARAEDPPERARLLGDGRLASVLARACRQQLRPPTDEVVVATDFGRVVLPAAEVAAAMEEIAARAVPHAVGRGALRIRLQRLAVQRHPRARPAGAAAGATGLAVEEAVRASADLAAAVGRLWPNASGPALVKRVLTSRRALGAAAAGVLDTYEQRRVLRKAVPKLAEEPWTPAELVLIDEAEALVNGVARTYGHVVVDEAQDLSAMQLRALARRCPSRSMTVLGDLAQATAPAAQSSWPDALVHLGSPAGSQVEELALGYRVPAPIMELANRLLPTLAPGVRPARSVRVDGRPPTIVAVDDDLLAAATVETVADLAERWASVGVVAPDAVRPALRGALRAGEVGFAEASRAGRGEAVTLLAPPEAKGLEFDAVVVVEPAAFQSTPEDDAGGRLLFVALTRAVQELHLVHARPLPTALTPARQ